LNVSQKAQQAKLLPVVLGFTRLDALNHVFISGYVVRDPELRYIESGTALVSFAITVVRNYQQGGEWKKETSFVDVKCWGELAERASEQLGKGAKVVIQGRLQQERWETAEGGARSRMVIVADHVEVVGQPKAKQAAGADDLPF
jgi:single-strand DNA-binding protein